MVNRLAVVASAVIAFAAVCRADVIVYVKPVVGSGCGVEQTILTQLPGTPIVITSAMLPTDGAGQPLEVCQIRIAAGVGESVGTVWMPGDFPGSGDIRLLVSSGASFPATPGTLVAPGAVDWGGVTAELTTVTDRLVVAAGTSGSLIGPIACGRIVRLQLAGDLEADAVASGVDLQAANLWAIEFVRFRSAAARIIATQGSIRTILAVPNSAAFGIGSDILAEAGSIGTITVTNGSIWKRPTDSAVQIRARNGITSISAREMKANVASNYNNGSGSLGVLECTAGGFNGSIDCASLVGVGSDLKGIRVAHGVVGPVTISGNSNRRIEVGTLVRGGTDSLLTITGNATEWITSTGDLSDIVIGGDLTASIIAGPYRRGSGTSGACEDEVNNFSSSIASVTIGGSVYSDVESTTLCGINGTVISARDGNLGPITVEHDISPGIQRETPGGVIAGRSGTNFVGIFANSLESLEVKGNCTAVMGTGSWFRLNQGCREYDLYGGSAMQVRDYIKCGGTLAGRYLIDGTPNIAVAHGTSALIRYQGTVSGGGDGGGGDPDGFAPGTGRFRIGGGHTGLISIEAPTNGLTGVLAMNTRTLPQAEYFGDVHARYIQNPEGFCSSPTPFPNLDSPIPNIVAAQYGQPDAELGAGGNGSVAFYPTGLHASECHPSTAAGFYPWAMPSISETQFDGRDGGDGGEVTLKFYGPVWTRKYRPVDSLDPDSPLESPIDLVFVKYITGWKFEALIPETDYRVIVGTERNDPAKATRTMIIKGRPGHRMYAGYYQIRPKKEVVNDVVRNVLLCGYRTAEEEALAPDLPVQDFMFDFVLGTDCDGDGFVDDPSGSTTCLNACGPHCIYADFNRDGGVDGNDLEAFLTAWEAGDSVADVNVDGGVDGSDLPVWLCYWEAGGC